MNEQQSNRVAGAEAAVDSGKTFNGEWMNDFFYSTVVALCSEQSDANFTVLDLGAGSGKVSERFRQQFPNCETHLLDLDGERLNEARNTFGDASARYFYRDFIQHPLPGEYDLVVSALSLHGLGAAQLNMVFSKIYRALKPGGRFINADLSGGGSEQIQARIGEQGIYEAFNLNPELIHAQLQPLEVQLNLLSAKGFEQVNCWLQYFGLCVYTGDKPSVNAFRN